MADAIHDAEYNRRLMANKRGGREDGKRSGNPDRRLSMSNDYLPKGKTQLSAWLANFNNVASAQMTSLGLTAADITALTGTTGNFNYSVAGVKTAKAALKSSTQAETAATKTVSNTVRGIVRRIQSNPAVTPAQKATLGVNPRSAPKNHAPPVTPTGLTVSGAETGVNTLNWNRAGNKQNTVFAVQAQIGASAAWVEVGAVTATKFAHTGQTPGVKVAYRLVARRAGMASVASAAATVYGAAPTVALTLLKAA